MYESMDKEGEKIVIHFDHAATGLAARNRKIRGFAVAGADRKFVWADATIEGQTVVVSSPAVPDPVAVRYAWADNPVCNLFNQSGLPVCPFRTDTWKGITADVK
jgi:sialate O-acetylesterase